MAALCGGNGDNGMRNLKARISKLETNTKPRQKLYKIYWGDG